MRISFRMISRQPLKAIFENLERLTDLQAKASTMKKYSKPSDDPQAVMKSMGFNTLLKQNEMYRTNVGNASVYLKMVDSTLISVKEQLDSAKRIALEQRNDVSSAEMRRAASIEVQGIISAVQDLMNTKFHGKYLFAGHETQTVPFQEMSGAIRYMGDDGLIQFRVGAARLIDVTVPGSRFESLGGSHSIDSFTMITSLSSATRLETLNEGLGVSPGRIRLEVDSGVFVDIDLSGAETIEDMVDMINNGARGAVPPINIITGINPSSRNSIVIQHMGSGEITVSELDGGTTGEDLGIIGTSVSGILRGAPLDPIMTLDTRITDVQPINRTILQQIRVVMGEDSHEVDFFSPAYPVTVGDMLSRIMDSVPGLEAEINASNDGIVFTADTSFSIEEVGAGTTAADLGILGASEPYGPFSLFAALETLEQALIQNDGDAIGRSLAEMEELINLMLEVEAEIGARGEQVDILDIRLQDSDTRLQENLSLVEDIDITEVLTELSEAQLAYEAALQTASTLYNLSLLKYY